MLKSNRILRSRSKEISTLKNAVGGVEQWEAKEFAMGECGAGVEEQQVRPSIHYQPDHSSLESISTDGTWQFLELFCYDFRLLLRLIYLLHRLLCRRGSCAKSFIGWPFSTKEQIHQKTLR